MHEPSMIQRLRREKALGGYLTALERGDIDGIIASLARAESDPVLEHMILEVHESYQAEEDFQTMFQEEQESSHSVLAKGNHALLPDDGEEEEFELEQASPLASVPQHRPGKPVLWQQVLAALLLIAFVSSSLLIYALRQQRVVTPLQPKLQDNWCTPPNMSISALTILESIFAVSPNDLWVLGETLQTNRPSMLISPSMEHWNGQSWNEVPTASTTALFGHLLSRVTSKGPMYESASLKDMAIVSADNIWAVGSIAIEKFAPQSIAPLSQTTNTVLAEQALIEHWDGNKWSIVPPPDIPDQGASSFSSIAAVSANDIWAIGASAVANKNTTAPLVEHWNGQIWQSVPFPVQQLHVGSLQAVKVVSSNDIWFFGLLKASSLTSIAVHWDGKNWSTIPLPDAISKSWFVDEVVIASNDIWATGGGGTSNGQTYPSFLAHWDGRQWIPVAGAQGIKTGSYLSKLAASRANDVWAVGTTIDNRPLIEHWDGQTWSLRPLKTPLYGFITGVAVAGGQTWIICSAYKTAANSILSGTIVETNCP